MLLTSVLEGGMMITDKQGNAPQQIQTSDHIPSSIAPLIDFGDDEEDLFASSFVADTGQASEPFNWGENQHYSLLNITSSETLVSEEDLLFGGPSFGEGLREIPPTMAIQAATIENQAGFDGMDLLTGSFEGLGRSFSSPLNTLLGSSQNTDVFSRQHSVDDGAFEPFNAGQPHSRASWIEHPFSTPPESSKPVVKPVGSLFEELPVAEAFTVVSLSSAEGATFMQAGQVTQERAAAVDALENTTSSCRTGERASHCEAEADKTVVGITPYPGAAVVSAKLASAVTFSENKPGERAKASWITNRGAVVDPENLPPSTASNPSGLVEPGPIKVSMNVRRSNDFFAAGGGKGVYKAPLRGYVHAGHPVPLELRPHPLKDTNLSTKAIVCTETSVWAASDTHLQVWDIESATRECSAAVDNLTGDEDAAAYHVLPVHGEPISCLAMDAANHIVWSGHRDGKVRGWPMQVGTEKPMTTTVPILMWEAHQSPVTAIAVSSYGELWVGSESGLINVWPCEATSGGVAHGQEDEMIAALFFARLCVPLRGLITGNNPSQTELYFLVAEHSAGRMWAGGILYITLWDARTREAMRVFGASLYSEPIVPNLGLPQVTQIPTDERASRRESGFGGWFQLSKSVFSGAADAIRRAADRSGFISEESRKLEALVASTDGTVWGAVGSATLVQWNQEGDRMQEVPVAAAPVKCLLVVGSRLWAGCTNGKVQVLSSKTGKLLGSWGGHQTAVLQMERGGSYVFTLAANGGIRGWHVASLSPLDSLLQTELSSRTSTFTQQRQLRVFAGTWNVAQGKASMQSLQAWLAGPAKHAGLMFVGLQEMEMGAGAIGMAAVKETVGGEFVNRGSANGQWWLDSIGAAIGEGKEFERVGSRQLAGLLLGAWVRKHLRPHVGDVDAGAVPCGFGRTFGNKGAVGVRMMIFRRTICVLNSHFAAHQEKVANRNSDFDYVYNNMTFGHKPGAVTSAAAGVSTAVQNILRGSNSRSSNGSEFQQSFIERDLYMETEGTEEATSPDLSDADILLWFGDFNYRIDVSYEQALSLIEKKRYDVLLLKDQLRNEMSSGRTFHGMREGFVGFAPTYKFDHGSQAYDTSEKKRVPAYCDRVVFRDSFDGNGVVQASKLSHPAKVSVAAYEACMEVTDSDHKPVRCLFNVDLAVVDEAARRRQFGDIMHNNAGVRACLERCNIVPHTIVNTNKVILEENSSSILEVSNESQAASATFTVHCEGEPSGQGCPCGTHTSSPKGPSHRGGYGFPRWLQVRPAAGMIGPQESVSIRIQHSGLGPFTQYTNSEASMDGQPSWWRDDQNGKVVVLVVTVRGPLTAAFEQHRLCVCKLPFSGSQDRRARWSQERGQGLGEKSKGMYTSKRQPQETEQPQYKSGARSGYRSSYAAETHGSFDLLSL